MLRFSRAAVVVVGIGAILVVLLAVELRYPDTFGPAPLVSGFVSWLVAAGVRLAETDREAASRDAVHRRELTRLAATLERLRENFETLTGPKAARQQIDIVIRTFEKLGKALKDLGDGDYELPTTVDVAAIEKLLAEMFLAVDLDSRERSRTMEEYAATLANVVKDLRARRTKLARK